MAEATTETKAKPDPKPAAEKVDELTPSAYGLKVAGEPKAGESRQKTIERAEVYAEAKAERRWG